MPKRKRGSGGGNGAGGGKGERGWGALPWRTVQVEEGALGEADDCFAFTIEEVDGSAYTMERDAVGGFKVTPHGGGGQQGQAKATAKKQKKEQSKGKGKGPVLFEPGEPTGPAEGAVVEEVEYVNDGGKKKALEALVALETQQQGADKKEAVAAAAAPTTKKEKKHKKKKDKQQQQQQQQPADQEEEEVEEEEEAAAAAASVTLDEAEVHAALPAWAAKAMGGVALHPLLLHNLRRQGFAAPTPIQRAALPLAMGVPGGPQGKDVMGAAETGSGKTLAYGLPILDHLLKQRDALLALPEGSAERAVKERGRRYLAALVLCPTRELALQVAAHLHAMLEGDAVPGRARINVVSIVGGLSETKQARLLGRRPEVVVATVGRFWELVQGNEAHLRDLGRLRFFVLDEADRMVEDGHFPELTRLLGSLVAQGKTYQKDYDEIRRGKKLAQEEQRRAAKQREEAEAESASDDDEEEEAPPPPQPKPKKQQQKAVEEEEGESDEEDLMSPVEIPTKTLADAIAAARWMGIKLEAVHGLEGEEGVGGGGCDGEEDGEEVDSVEVDGELEELEEGSEGEEEGGEGTMEVEDVKGDLEADVTPQEDPASWRELPPPVVRQALIFSATLSMPAELREGKSKKKNKGKKGKGGGGKDGGESVIHRIMKEVGMRGQPAVVDLSGAGPAATMTAEQPSKQQKALALPPGLELCFIKTVGGQKDAYLYYFLRRFPGRSLVFTNSIDQTRRLAQLLAALRLPARALHAKQQQRQRLKSLDAFRAQTEAVLVATDVAARGLDIPAVDHVIHYDLPRSLEVFVHRAGRTARAQRRGLSFSLVAPRDERMHAEVGRLLEAGAGAGGGEEDEHAAGMAPFPVDLQELNAVRERVGLAGRIVGYDQEQGGKQASQAWFLKAARDADLELDEELLEEAAGGGGSEKERQRALQVARDRERLAELLARPVVQERRKFVDVAARLRMLGEAEAERGGGVGGKGAGGGVGAQGAEARRVLHKSRKEKAVKRKGGVVG